MEESNEQELTPLAQYLKTTLKERRMSLATLAKGAGLSQQTIKMIMKGQRPNLDSCRKIADFLRVSWLRIFTLVYTDVDYQRIKSMFELYEDLPEPQRQHLEKIAFDTHELFGKHTRAGIHAVKDERVETNQ